MKLKDWAKKILGNIKSRLEEDIPEYEIKHIIKENLKAFVQDTDVVKIKITDDNLIYAVVEE